jgi:hypothetical protein
MMKKKKSDPSRGVDRRFWYWQEGSDLVENIVWIYRLPAPALAQKLVN